MSDQTTTALEREPIIDRLNERQVQLLRDMSPNLGHGELARAVELAWAYGLDPYAREIWFEKAKARDGREGRLLIMVGRDGLRKIAQRNGLWLDGDVVHAGDRFSVKRGHENGRTVEHEYGPLGERGEIVGAWAECREGGPAGKPMGFFYAALSEYMPANVDSRSVWAKQVSVMILAAAERQAVRQATPLGGLLAEGEDELVAERVQNEGALALEPGAGDGGAEAAAGAEGAALPQAETDPFDGILHADTVREVIAEARALGHAGLSDVATAQMTLRDQPEERVVEWVKAAAQELDKVRAQPLATEAEAPVEPAAEAAPATAEAGAGEAQAPAEQESRGQLLERADNLLTKALLAREAGDEDAADAFEARAEDLREQAGPEPEGQATMEF